MEGLNEYSLMLLELVHARMSNNKEQLYEKLYVAITNLFKKELINTKPPELCYVISELIAFYQMREEYEKCQRLNEVGYEVFNTIVN